MSEFFQTANEGARHGENRLSARERGFFVFTLKARSLIAGWSWQQLQKIAKKDRFGG